MIGITKDAGKVTYGLKEYVVDTAAEVDLLPTNCAMGSSVFVIETGDDDHKSYMEIHGNSIASLDTKEMVVLDENGNDVTNKTVEAKEEPKEEIKEEQPEVKEEVKEEKVAQLEIKPKKSRKKVAFLI